jgi:hypothetical protein
MEAGNIIAIANAPLQTTFQFMTDLLELSMD